LLGIAVVNAGLLAPQAPRSVADRVAAVVVTALLENRSWPVFALMFGFGLAAIGARLDHRGISTAARNRVLRRRSGWLAAAGLAQAALVFWGDILAVYGLTGLVVVALLGGSWRARVAFGALSVATWLLGTAALGAGSGAVPDSADYVTSVGERLATFAFWTGANTLALTHLAPMLVGVALFEIGALHRPAAHLRLLRRLATWGFTTGLVGAVPLCLVVAGAWAPSSGWHALALGLHAGSGSRRERRTLPSWPSGRPAASPRRRAGGLRRCWSRSGGAR